MTKYLLTLATLVMVFFGFVLICEGQSYDGLVNPYEFADTTKWTPVTGKMCLGGGRPHKHIILKNVDETHEIKFVEIVVYPTPTGSGMIIGYAYKDGQGKVHQFLADGKGNYKEVIPKPKGTAV